MDTLRAAAQAEASSSALLVRDLNGNPIFTAAERSFLKTSLRSRDLFHRWRETQIKLHRWKHDRNPSSSASDWNTDVYLHDENGCWAQIFHFCERHCKQAMQIVKKHLAAAMDLEEARAEWIKWQKQRLQEIRKSGLSWGIPVDVNSPAWRNQKPHTDPKYFVALLSRAFHHMDGTLLRRVIATYMRDKDADVNARVLREAISEQCTRTEGINPPDATYFRFLRDYQGLQRALDAGLRAMGERVALVEWCADWEPQLLFWAYPRGPGFAVIARALREDGLAERIDRQTLHRHLLDCRHAWEEMIIDAWAHEQPPQLPGGPADSPRHADIRACMQRICTEFTIRTLPWWLSGCPGKALNPLRA